MEKYMARGFHTHIVTIFKEEYEEHGKERMKYHII
jgi:actin-related protein